MERYHKFAALHRQAATESAAGLPALDRFNYVQRELGLMWGDLSEEAKAEYHVGVDEPCERKPAPAKKVAASHLGGDNCYMRACAAAPGWGRKLTSGQAVDSAALPRSRPEVYASWQAMTPEERKPWYDEAKAERAKLNAASGVVLEKKKSGARKKTKANSKAVPARRKKKRASGRRKPNVIPLGPNGAHAAPAASTTEGRPDRASRAHLRHSATS